MADPVLALRQRIAKAAKAQALHDDALLGEVLDVIADTAIVLWRAAVGPSLADVRERQHSIVVGVDSVRAQLLAIVADGAMARAELDAIDEQE